MRSALLLHDRMVRAEIEAAGGHVFKTVGDAFCAVFDRAEDAAAAAVSSQQALAAASWPSPVEICVRIGIHSGICDERDGDYFGPTVNRAARLEAVAHGGQTVVSKSTAELLHRAVPPVVLIDLGEHRLKDLGQPERVFQLQAPGLPEEFPPLRSLDNPALRHNLPAQASSFVGRVTELQDVRLLVEANRLVTLAGAGGSGKTRLALQVASDLLDGTGDGVWFVDLSSLATPDLVPATVASVLGQSEEPDLAMTETLSDALRDRQMLLVIDNCEHLIDACAKLVDSLVRSCPGLHVLTTSREPLGVDGEQIYRVPSLSLPPVEPAGTTEPSSSDAVELFVSRARLARPDFRFDAANADVVVALCRRLDGIPLAIELAAARLRTLSAAGVLERLDDRFRLLTGGTRTALGRHRTLQALVDWSYELLNEQEKEVLSCLSVFSGGFSLDAAETVCGEHLRSFEVLDLVGSLVDKSLVEFDTSRDGQRHRYRLLETIREYAGDRLSERPEADMRAVRESHARAFRTLAEESARFLSGPDQGVWLAQLEQEHDNLRAAFDQFARDGNGTDSLRLAVALNSFWRFRGHFTEGIDTLERALANAEGMESELVCSALVAQGALRTRHGEYSAARELLESALGQARRLGLDVLAADALGELAYVEMRLGNYTGALPLIEEAVALARRAGDSHVLSVSLDVQANVFDYVDNEPGAALPPGPRARENWSEALEHARSAGNARLAAVVLNNLAGVEMRDGDLSVARTHLQDALAVGRVLDDDSLNLSVLTNLGFVGVMAADYAAAVEAYREALGSSRRMGSMHDAAYALHGLALCRSAAGDDDDAVVLHAAAHALFERLGETLDPDEAPFRDRDLARLRSEVGTAAFEASYARGRGLSVEDAIRLALHTAPEGEATRRARLRPSPDSGEHGS